MAPSLATCEEKSELIAQFVKAVADYHRMQSAQVLALSKGQGFQFEEQISAAREQMEAARRALRMHASEHGC